jgi:hypothetical protein
LRKGLVFRSRSKVRPRPLVGSRDCAHDLTTDNLQPEPENTLLRLRGDVAITVPIEGIQRRIRVGTHLLHRLVDDAQAIDDLVQVLQSGVMEHIGQPERGEPFIRKIRRVTT